MSALVQGAVYALAVIGWLTITAGVWMLLYAHGERDAEYIDVEAEP